MSVVHLYLDCATILKPDPDHILIRGLSDYVPAYARMAEAIHAGPPPGERVSNCL